MPDGTAVEAVTLVNGAGTQATLISYGAAIQSLRVQTRNGRITDVVLGFNDLDGYLAAKGNFGATIGRYANRIANAAFELDGKRRQLVANQDGSTLHGGPEGFARRVWTIDQVKDGIDPSVTFSLTSADGDQGFPGTLRTSVTYTLSSPATLRIDYRATTDQPTVVSLTNHAYFNLHGEDAATSAEDALLTIPAERFLPVDNKRLPTGEIRPVAGTAFDFRRPAEIGARMRDGRDRQILLGRGYDHTFLFAAAQPGVVRRVARLYDQASGTTLEVLSDAPALQLFSGNNLDGSQAGKSGLAYRMGDGIALEPERIPNLPNMPLLGSARLDPGSEYRATIVYRLSIAGRPATAARPLKPLSSVKVGIGQ